MSSIKILVACHAKCDEPEFIKKNPELYVPVLCGADYKPDIEVFWKDMHKDNEGENISWLNPQLCEFTCLYWAWKNYDMIGNPDYIGLNHYRRFYKTENFINTLDPNIIYLSFYKCAISAIDDFNCVHGNVNGFNESLELLSNLDERYKSPFINYFNSDVVPCCSLFVMHKDMFNEMMKVLSYIAEHIACDIDFSYNNDAYQSRYYAFLFERLIGFVILFLTKNKSNTYEFKHINFTQTH